MDFSGELARIRNGWRRGLAVCVGLDLAAASAAAFAVICALDLLLALDSGWRLGLGGALAFLLVVAAAWRIARIWALDAKAAAMHADRLLSSRRREALSALELSRMDDDAAGLFHYCITASVASATARLRAIRDPRPLEALRAARNRLLITAAVACLAVLLNPSAALTAAGRLLAPFADIPPWSRYRFAVQPVSPKIIYGADEVISVTISGAPVRQPVRFATRQGGRTIELACFQGSPTNFAQRIERVTQPLEFCFRVGKARSCWQSVAVLLQPIVESVEVRIAPPAYSHKPERVFALGAEPLAGMRGSQVEMSIRSNRPLGHGSLSIDPVDGISAGRTVEGARDGIDSLKFRWPLDATARLTVLIRDVLGTPGREPLKISQELVPDAPPKVTLDEPAPFSLATPSITVPISGFVEDDLSLRRVDLLRNLTGYRQRGVEVNSAPGASSCTVTGSLALAPLGVEPGQVIEVLIEAMDNNPELTGIGASGIAHVQIISEDAYADIIRNQTTLEAFSARFEELSKSFGELIHDLEAAQQAMRAGGGASREAAARMPALRERVEAAAKAMRQLAGDFAAFDIEKALSATADRLASGLEKSLEHTGWQAAEPGASADAVDATLDAMRPRQPEVAKLDEDASQIAAVGRVMACAARYRALLERQEMLAGRLDRYAAGEKQLIDPLRLADSQDAIRGDLGDLRKEIEDAARVLPGGYEELRDSALGFASAMDALKIPAPMSLCATACRNSRSREARDEGFRALALMRELLSNCKGCMAGLCQGGLSFSVPGDLSATMSQMLASLMHQFGSGAGTGLFGAAGLGWAGTSEGSRLDGYAMQDVPVYGPNRRNPLESVSGRKQAGGEGGRGGGVPRQADFHEAIQAEMKKPAGGSGIATEAVPARYREAVKAFYGEDK